MCHIHVNYTNMKKEVAAKRPYRKTARARAELENEEAILRAARSAFRDEPFDRVTLKGIALESGVTVQTVIRRFGSKESLFEALVEQERPRVLASREVSPDASVWQAMEALIDHYEQDGDLILNFVAQETRIEAIRSVVSEGRVIHRQWIERYCAPVLAGLSGDEREYALAAAIAATDLGTWKLLRRDLGYSRDAVVTIMTGLVTGIERRT